MSRRRRFQKCEEIAKRIVHRYRAECPESIDPQATWAIVAVGVGTAVTAGTTYAASQKSKKAAGQAAAGLKSGTQQFEPTLLGDPKTVNPTLSNYQAIKGGLQNLPFATTLSNLTNNYNFRTAQKYYQRIQPYFSQLQSQIGQNALSFAQGKLPDDVASEIGRRAAEQGIQGGYGFGSQGARQGALANLNLRNLGLASLDLSRFGTQLGMQVNQSAKSLLPNLVSPTEFLLSPSQYLSTDLSNAQVQNQFALRNNQILNEAGMQNTALNNSLNQATVQSQYNQALTDAQMLQQVGSAIGGAIGGYGNLLGQRQAPQINTDSAIQQGSLANARSVLQTYPRALV